MKRSAIAIATVLLAAAAAFSQERFVTPVDEGASDASFSAFRKRLLDAADRKDISFVLAVLDRNAKLSFGGHSGAKGFKELWKDQAAFWKEFNAVIRNGGRFTGDGRNAKNSFTAPYVFTDFPDDLDAFEHTVIFGTDVNLRSEPNTSSQVVARLSHTVVKVVEDPRADPDARGEPEWRRVQTLGGVTGYVASKYLRSPIDYRAGFEKKNGVWKMTFFLAGD